MLVDILNIKLRAFNKLFIHEIYEKIIAFSYISMQICV